MGIIKQKLWKNITQGDEDRALAALRKFRSENPDRFRQAA
jgi:ribulose bisphosphate carboxylase small subunit